MQVSRPACGDAAAHLAARDDQRTIVPGGFFARATLFVCLVAIRRAPANLRSKAPALEVR